MKTKLILSFLLFTFSFLLSLAQVPQGFNYQAIARDGSGNPIVGATIKVRLSLLTDTSAFRTGGGVYVWEEEHTGVLTNAYGLFNISMGTGSRVQGVTKFGLINWSLPNLYLGTKIANPTTFKSLGGAKLWSVPYAMNTGNISGTLKKLTVKGETVDGDSILFEVRNKRGQTVFAVYNEGVRIYVADGDSVTSTSKGKTKGGFAIGGFGSAKAPSQEYLVVTRDSTRVYVNPNPPKGTTKGGFAIGGFSGKSGDNNYLDMTPQNYFIGQAAGKSNVGGLFNAYIGTQAGYKNINGNYNIILGREAGYNNTASSNIFVGDLTGKANTTGAQNVMIGDWAGYYNTTGEQNVFLGAQAGWNNIAGSYNNFMGFDAGYWNTAGSYNSYIGYQAGFNNKTGQRNTYIGFKSGYSGLNASASNNIFIGDSAGYSNTTGYDNIAIGNGAGETILDGDYNIMIGSEAGNKNASGNYNTIMGYKAGEKTTSDYATMIGYQAGNFSIVGNSQTMIGYQAGYQNTGSYNTYLGVLAGGHSGTGFNNTYVGLAAGNEATGNHNVFIGKWAGWYETGSNKLIIESNYSGSDNLNNALIFGDFSTKQLRFNGNVGVNTNPGTISLYSVDTKVTNDDPAVLGQHNITANYGIGVKGVGGWYGVIGEAANAGGVGFRAGVFGSASGGVTNYGIYGFAPVGASSYAGYFNGNVYVNGAITETSDKTLKKNILPLSGSLQKVLSLQGVSYEWKSESELVSVNTSKSSGGKENDKKSFNFPTGLQIGVIAQDVEKIVPELVKTDVDGFKSVDYTKIIPLLIEAIKDQQRQIDELKATVKVLSGQSKK